MNVERRIAIVTSERWPELSASDALLANELDRRGHDVFAQPWNDGPVGAFTTADLVILRSNWGFHHEIERFEDWLLTVDESDAALHNSADLVIAYNRKSYLDRLAGLGLPTPATLALDEFNVDVIRAWIIDRGFEFVVIKPVSGASGYGVEQVALSDLDDFRVNSQYGGTVRLAQRVDPAALSLASRVLASLGTPPTYARIDIVGTGEGVKLMDVEVNEPALGLHLAPGAASRFDDALLRTYS